MPNVRQGHRKNLIVEALRAGTVHIPHGLIKFYKRLELNEAQTMLLIHLLSFRERDGKTFPTIHELQERMAIPGPEVVEHLRRLVRKQYIAIIEETDEHGVRASRYDFEPLYQRLADCYLEEWGEELDRQEEARESGMVTKFEQEFGRPLSPMECEILVKWLEEDKLSDELILAALKEAVFAGKLNFKYIDRILFEWKRNRVRTVEQAKTYALNFHKKGTIYKASAKKQTEDDFPFYNWVES